MSANKKHNSINTTFHQKKIFHKDSAKLSFEKKLECLVELQKLGLEMKKSANREIKPYETIWILK